MSFHSTRQSMLRQEVCIAYCSTANGGGISCQPAGFSGQISRFVVQAYMPVWELRNPSVLCSKVYMTLCAVHQACWTVYDSWTRQSNDWWTLTQFKVYIHEHCTAFQLCITSLHRSGEWWAVCHSFGQNLTAKKMFTIIPDHASNTLVSFFTIYMYLHQSAPLPVCCSCIQLHSSLLNALQTWDILSLNTQ